MFTVALRVESVARWQAAGACDERSGLSDAEQCRGKRFCGLSKAEGAAASITS